MTFQREDRILSDEETRNISTGCPIKDMCSTHIEPFFTQKCAERNGDVSDNDLSGSELDNYNPGSESNSDVSVDRGVKFWKAGPGSVDAGKQDPKQLVLGKDKGRRLLQSKRLQWSRLPKRASVRDERRSKSW